MTVPSPSAVVAQIVETLGATLHAKLGSKVDVRAHAGDFGADGKDFVTAGPLAVLVAALDLPVMDEYDFVPAVADATFVAVCLARAGDPANGQAKRSDVAMDLAGLVAALVRPERWGGLAAKVPSRIRCRNQHTNALALKGLSVWSVFWSQHIELQPTFDPAVLHRLGSIHSTIAPGGDATPPILQTTTYPETP